MLAFYLISSGKAWNDSTLALSGIVLQPRKWAEASGTGRTWLLQKGVSFAASFACRRPSLGWWFIFSVARAGLVSAMWLIARPPCGGSWASFRCCFPSCDFCPCLSKSQMELCRFVCPGKCDWRGWAPFVCSSRAQNAAFSPQTEPRSHPHMRRHIPKGKSLFPDLFLIQSCENEHLSPLVLCFQKYSWLRACFLLPDELSINKQRGYCN